MGTGTWIAWPRRVVVARSDTYGASFARPAVISESGTDPALAADSRGGVVASFKAFIGTAPSLSQAKCTTQAGDGAFALPVQCLPWGDPIVHDQTSLHVAPNGVVHVIAMDIQMRREADAESLHYARSLDGGKAFTDVKKMRGLGQLPQVVAADGGLIIAGLLGFVVSKADGVKFGSPLGSQECTPRIAPRRGRKRRPSACWATPPNRATLPRPPASHAS